MFTPGGHLYRVDQMPAHFRELFIISGYRSPRSSAHACICSAVEPTNETMNFWTHIIPAIFFLWKFYMLTYHFDFIGDSFTWPMLIFMLSLCMYPCVSAFAHIFNAMSDRARHICFFIDYAAVSFYGLCSALVYRAYILPVAIASSSLANIFLYIAVINAVISMALSCETRFMHESRFRKFLRTFALGFPYAWDSIPLIYRIILCENNDCGSQALLHHSRQFIMASMALFFYASHMPERLLPGKFDVFGHSHQIFHIVSAIGTYDQLNGILLDMEERKHFLVSHTEILSFGMSIGMPVMICCINLFLLALFCIKLYQHMPNQTKQIEDSNANLKLEDSKENGYIQTGLKYRQNRGEPSPQS